MNDNKNDPNNEMNIVEFDILLSFKWMCSLNICSNFFILEIIIKMISTGLHQFYRVVHLGQTNQISIEITSIENDAMFEFSNCNLSFKNSFNE